MSFTVTQTISKERVRDLLITAFEGGVVRCRGR